MSDPKLTACMKLCLESIEQAPGTRAQKLPGGMGTVNALMRRGLAELDHETRVFKPQHQHAFSSTMHLDGCHYYSNDYVCKCGVKAHSYSERSMTDPYSIVWMEPSGEPCVRCEELIAGARPRHQVTIWRSRDFRLVAA
jgi:hypothetical protein